MPSKPQRNTLEIRLTESVVFLRDGDAAGRHRSHGGTAPPAMLRGLLILNLVKPTRISSIEVELVGKTSTAWPEGVGARRIEVAETHKFYTQSYVFFDASSAPTCTRRTLSVGPGLFLDHEEEDRSEESSEHDYGNAEERRGREPTRGRPERRAQPELRRLSVDQTFFQRGFVAHTDQGLPTPPYSPRYSPEASPLHSLSPTGSISRHSMAGTHEESPAQSLEEFRRALLQSGHSLTRGHSSPRLDGTVASPTSPVRGSISRRESFELDEPEFVLGSSRTYAHHASHQSSAAPSRTPSRAPSPGGHGHDDRGRGKSKRLSLASVSNVLMDVVRSVSRATDRERERESITPQRGRTRDRSWEEGEHSMTRSRTGERRKEGGEHGMHKERTTLGRVTEALGLDMEEGKEHGEGWKEFRKGVYTYPITFAIPADQPPTLTCELGHVTWRLKAHAHRPGAFTTKLSATQEVHVVSAPGEDDTEENESIIVERQWEDQMQYLITISGRSFPIGSTIPISLTFIPWTKMKVFRLSVVIEERIDYLTQFKRIARTDLTTRALLLSWKSPSKDTPLLPFIPSATSSDTFAGSPLIEAVNPGDDPSEVASGLMGPGPWTIHKELQLPQTCHVLHFTNKNRRSNIIVSHVLKVVFRVQRGDDTELDAHGKRKMFDIVVQTPIHLLSCLCSHDYTALPPYFCDSSQTALPTGLCRCVAGTRARALHIERQTTAPPEQSTYQRGHVERHPEASTSNAGPSPVSALAVPEPASSGPNAQTRRGIMLDLSTQFERLVTGQETERGEAPPAYDVAVASPLQPQHPPVHHHVHAYSHSHSLNVHPNLHPSHATPSNVVQS